MASAPVYPSTARCEGVVLNNALGTSNSAGILAGVSAGTRVTSIRVCSGPTTAPGGTTKVDILIDDGTNQYIWDTFAMTNTADLLQYSKDAAATPFELILPSTYTIKAVSRTALASGSTLHLTATGQDLT